MHKLNIKPLSLNSAYRGRRFASKTLQIFKKEVLCTLHTLPTLKLNFTRYTGGLGLRVIYGTSKSSDLDNLNKTFIDCLSEFYGFNDNRIYEIHMQKDVVKKGQEYIAWELYILTENK